MKTVQRFFTVSGVLVTFFVLMVALTPLSSAVKVDSTVYKLPIDNSFPTLYSYFFGNNTGIVDFKQGNNWYRVVINNNFAKCIVYSDTVSYRTHYYVRFDYMNKDVSGKCWYWTNIGTSYSSSSPFSSSNWYDSLSTSYDLGTNYPYINSCAAPIETTLTDTQCQYCDFNSFYPLVTVSGNGSSVDLNPVLNNQTTIVSKIDDLSSGINDLKSSYSQNYSKQESAADSRVSSQEAAANSRQSEIMDAGSDVTVSTIDNWVGGNNGLAGKLTELAATLSSNADIFSQNQSQNQANLSKAGEFVGNVFNQIPTGITAAAVCFLIILIAVKVVGR